MTSGGEWLEDWESGEPCSGCGRRALRFYPPSAGPGSRSCGVCFQSKIKAEDKQARRDERVRRLSKKLGIVRKRSKRAS